MAPLQRGLSTALPKIAPWGPLGSLPRMSASPHPHQWEDTDTAFITRRVIKLFVRVTSVVVDVPERGFLDLDDKQLAALDAHLASVRPLTQEQRNARRQKLTEAANFFKG